MDFRVAFNARAFHAMQSYPAQTREAIRRSLMEAATLVQERARREHRFRTRTGMLERSIAVKLEPTNARVFLDRNVARYSGWVHEGTAPHMIFPNKRKALRWVGPNGFVFAKKVRHPGTKPDQFLYKALDNSRAEIQAIFDRHIQRVTGG